MAQRRSKGEPIRPMSGQSSGKVDPTKIPDSAGPQAPTTDPLHANANKSAHIAGAPATPATSSNEITSKHDHSGMSPALYDADMYGENERELANQILNVSYFSSIGFCSLTENSKIMNFGLLGK